MVFWCTSISGPKEVYDFVPEGLAPEYPECPCCLGSQAEHPKANIILSMFGNPIK